MTITLKDFFQFLMDNKIFYPYMKYLRTNDKWRKKQHTVENASSFLTHYENEGFIDHIILHAFSWEKTYEGYNFWQRISNQWRHFIIVKKIAYLYNLRYE